MKAPKNPMSKEAHEHFSNKVKRGEKFHSDAEKKKMVKRLRMFDRGFVEKKGPEVEYGR